MARFPAGKAGDLIVFDTALFHCGCPALSPYGGELLRAVCIMSMAPVRTHARTHARTHTHTHARTH
eukprot:COSAG03_NODE_15019_length_443_cov_3.526163_1_plen_65_part_10